MPRCGDRSFDRMGPWTGCLDGGELTGVAGEPTSIAPRIGASHGTLAGLAVGQTALAATGLGPSIRGGLRLRNRFPDDNGERKRNGNQSEKTNHGILLIRERQLRSVGGW